MGKARTCAVYGCTPSKSSNFKYYKFPKNKTIARQWLQKCYRADKVNINNAVICEQHFSSAQIKRNLKYELLGTPAPRTLRELKTEAVPDQNLPFRGLSNGNVLSAENTGVSRSGRLLKKSSKRTDFEAMVEMCSRKNFLKPKKRVPQSTEASMERRKKSLVIKGKEVKHQKKAIRKDKGKQRFTSYMIWAADKRQEIIKENPNMSFSDINKRLGELWNLVSHATKYNLKRRARRLTLKLNEERCTTSSDPEFCPPEEIAHHSHQKQRNTENRRKRPKPQESDNNETSSEQSSAEEADTALRQVDKSEDEEYCEDLCKTEHPPEWRKSEGLCKTEHPLEWRESEGLMQSESADIGSLEESGVKISDVLELKYETVEDVKCEIEDFSCEPLTYVAIAQETNTSDEMEGDKSGRDTDQILDDPLFTGDNPMSDSLETESGNIVHVHDDQGTYCFYYTQPLT